MEIRELRDSMITIITELMNTPYPSESVKKDTALITKGIDELEALREVEKAARIDCGGNHHNVMLLALINLDKVRD